MKIPSFQRVGEYCRHVGVSRTLARSAYVGVNQALRVSIFEAMTMTSSDMNTGLFQEDGLTGRALDAEQMLRYADELGENGDVLRYAAARENFCYGVFDGPELSSIALFSSQATPLLSDMEIHFKPPDWYMYGGFTFPKYRGRRLHARSTLGGARILFNTGISRLVTVAEWTNYPSITSSYRMGWKPGGHLCCTGTGTKARFWASKGARRLGMRLQRRTGSDHG